jgi:copper chaperone CopZ
MISNTVLKGATAFVANVAGTGGCPSALHLDLAHHLPGRLRLRSALFKGNARASEETQRHLAEIRGVTSARANPTTGSVLLEYDPDVISPSKVSDVLAAHGYILRRLALRPKPEIGGRRNWRAIQDWAINALLERLALAMISALA